MCGRFTLVTDVSLLKSRYVVEDMPAEFGQRYNIAPTQRILAVFSEENLRKIGLFHWGLIPSWAADEKIASKMINARAETIFSKPSFRQLIFRKRCLIPADSFYEWKQIGKVKQPMRILMKDETLFSMAGLYDVWVNADGRKISSCTVITTVPNKLMADIHNRMPVILKPEDESLWLNDDEQDPSVLKELLVPYDTNLMKSYPVHPMVGNVKNDIPACIEPDDYQLELF